MDDCDYVGAGITPDEADDGSHTITFSGYDTSVINVDANGKVTVVGEGFTEIYVSVDGVSYGAVSVKVDLPDPITNITIDADYYELMNLKVGQSSKLGYYLSPYENDGVYQAINWYSSDEYVATVSDDGVVFLHAYGVVEITVEVVIDSDTKYSDYFIINFSSPIIE